MFTLAGTFEHDSSLPDVVLREEVVVDDQRRVFRFPKSRKVDQVHEDAVVSANLTDMVEQYLELEDRESDELPRKTAQHTEPSQLTADHEVEEYVYDIYYRNKDVGHEWVTTDANVGIM